MEPCWRASGARRGDGVAFADADGATAPASLLALVAALDDFDVVVGSRHIAGSRIPRAQSVQRQVLGWIFARTVHLLFALPVRDTQCGAKALRAPIAKHMCGAVTEKQWAFDVDLLVEAMRMGARICEYPVVWTDQPGSRLRVAPTALEVARALRRIHVKATAHRVEHIRNQPELPVPPSVLVP